MKEKEEKQKGNFWLTAATFIVNKRKAIEILFILAIIYSVLSINKVQVNQDITSYLPADSETRQGLSIMDEQFVTYGSAKLTVHIILREYRVLLIRLTECMLTALIKRHYYSQL